MLGLIYATTAGGAFYAFTDWTGVGSFDFVGLKNFTKIFQTPELTGALVNTLLLAFGFLVLTNVLGLLFALALNRTLKSRYVLRTLLFMPVVLAPIAVSYVWKFIFAFEGPLNQTLGAVGLKSLQHDWLADPHLAASRHPRRHGLAEHRVHHGHLPRRPGDGAGGAGGGGRPRRRRARDALPHDHGPDSSSRPSRSPPRSR